ncbi:hypothetical protein ACVCL0_14220 [Rhodanobacter sp. UC4450_H17]|jgi:hypothetical protein
MSTKGRDLASSEKLSEICVLFNSMEAVISSLYDALEEFGSDGGQAYGLAMTLENLNNQVGRHAGAI